MTLLNKFGIGGGHGGPRNDRSAASGAKAQTAVAPAAGAAAPRAPEQHVATRVSNGLKEFLWNLDGLGRGTLLDLGPAWQTTLNFFIERGFPRLLGDVLRGWKGFLDEEETRLREDPTRRDTVDISPDGRAARFLKKQFAVSRGILRCSPSLGRARLSRPCHDQANGGVFDRAAPPRRHRFRDVSQQKTRRFPALSRGRFQHLAGYSREHCHPLPKIYQNREIQDLFSHYRTMKSFVGRDQLRETLFIK